MVDTCELVAEMSKSTQRQAAGGGNARHTQAANRRKSGAGEAKLRRAVNSAVIVDAHDQQGSSPKTGWRKTQHTATPAAGTQARAPQAHNAATRND
eukprot:CAMPEP_0171057516 /NCGR_PEP_ID=MMETSP0766_2-20121228/1866_1 /TAXON_ID=439317 /ORGANISM="Gambierdiscus australes, Strain CAWD 149" /LENGTH=95 /DNA_ID=CAMNT_0011512657 /DNA_START=349 /DNA_END=634 /DNA_ORIENTATION=-